MAKMQIFNATDPKRRPFMDQSLADRVKVSCPLHKTGKRYECDVSIPGHGFLRMNLRSGKSIGILDGFLCPMEDEQGKHQIDVFEPGCFVSVRLVGK